MENQWSDLVSVVRNDIVFEARNKTYGAYEIRREYGRSLILALLFSAAIISTLFIVPLIYNLIFTSSSIVEIPSLPGTQIQTIIREKEIIIPPPTTSSAKKEINTKEIISPQIEENVPEENAIPSSSNYIKNIQTGAGTEGEYVQVDGHPTIAIDEPEKIYDITIEEPATFPGGEGELMRFISEKIQYPVIEKENGIQGKVYLSFIIDKNGDVTNIDIIKGLKNGPGCDKEAMRIAGIFPKWNPGKQNGNPVKMRFILPICFKLR